MKYLPQDSEHGGNGADALSRNKQTKRLLKIRIDTGHKQAYSVIVLSSWGKVRQNDRN